MIQVPACGTEGRSHGVWLWIVLIGAGSIALSRAFACATPFAALATLAAFTLRPRDAAALVLFVWAANQAVGFGFLHYPHDPTTLAWGAVIGVAALGGLMAAQATAAVVRLPVWVAVAVGLAAAYVADKAVLFAATWLLASGSGALTAAVVARIFGINVAALALLLGIHHAAGALGWPVGAQVPAT